MATLNWVDYLILAVFFFSTLAGFGRGFVREIMSLVSLIAAFVVASMFAHELALTFTGAPAVQNMLSEASSSIGVDAARPVSYVTIAISFALLFAGTYIIGSLIGYFLNMAFQFGVLGLGNRLFGAVFGMARGFIFNLVLIFLVQLTPFGTYAVWQQSQFVISFQPAVQWLANIVSPNLANLKERFGSSIQDVNSSIRDMTNSYQGFSR